MKASGRAKIKFPCDCISSTAACEEPWAEVAKRGMFKDGTKEEILNCLAKGPMTIAQLARRTRLAQPTVFRHIADLAGHRLVREVNPETKAYVFERYYTPAFLVVSRQDQALLKADEGTLARSFEAAFRRHLPSLQKKFLRSNAAAEGWTFNEFAQVILHAVQREARAALEGDGTLARKFPTGRLDFAFWGME